MKNIWLCLTLIAMSGITQAQKYKIEFEIKGLSDTTIYLGNYFGESTYIKDTAKINPLGQFEFEGNKELEEGMYFLVLNKTRLFDFLVGSDKEFKLSTSTENYVTDLKIEGDIENELFIGDLLFNSERNKEAAPYVNVIQDSSSTESAIAAARKALDEINEKVVIHQNEIINQHSQMLLSRILKANQRLSIPEAPEGTDENQFGYSYMRNHYWDNFDLADDAMLRLSRPVYKEKVENYFERMLAPQADTILKEVKKLAEIAKTDRDTYKYFIWTLTLKYQNPSIMGLDEVFVRLIDTYFESGEMDFWANAQLKKNLKERADQLRLSLIGNQAPNMIMMDKDKQMRSMHGINKDFTILYFFDPDCGHCKKETPVLKKFYDNTKFDVEVFAVSADTSMMKMTKYIQDQGLNWITVNGPRTSTGSYHNSYDAMTTPTIYVLDRKKNIIAKKIPSARLEDFLTQYQKFQNKAD